jgi:hypothetical protein
MADWTMSNEPASGNQGQALAAQAAKDKSLDASPSN